MVEVIGWIAIVTVAVGLVFVGIPMMWLKRAERRGENPFN